MRLRAFVCVLLLIPVLAYGQSGAGMNTNRPRSSYDPAAAGRPQAAQESGDIVGATEDCRIPVTRITAR